MERFDRRAVLRLGCDAAAVAAVGALLPLAARATSPAVDARPILNVGPSRAVKTLREAARQARDGDLVLVDPADYRADVAVWTQKDVVVRGNGGRPRLIADGASAEDKATFVFRNADATVEDVEFVGARSRDRNGAGIRLDTGSRLNVVRCHFEDNENGILTSNDRGSELHLRDSSFVLNGLGDGQAHNVYVGTIGRLTATGCYFARTGGVGHLLKSRARESVVSYCRLTGEDGLSSYELEFPNGGRALVIGCLIQQGPKSENSAVVAYGAEGYRWDDNELNLSFSTIVNDRSSSVFVRAMAGAVRVQLLDNLFVGQGRMDLRTADPVLRNHEATRGDFADPARFDYRLRRTSKLVGAAGMAGRLDPARTRPDREYLHTARTEALAAFTALTPLSPGAFQRLA